MAYKVLVCDDARSQRSLMCAALEKGGYEILGQAQDGKEAVELYKELRPDLVMLDITMPVMGGMEALKEILQADSCAKVVMVSAMGQQAQEKEAIRMGAKGAVCKPFRNEKLLETVKKALA